MIVESSAPLAIIRREPLSSECFQALFSSPVNRLSAANFLEVCLVVDGPQDPTATRDSGELIELFSIDIEPVSVDQAYIARRAHQIYGRGRGHPARLNFGGCSSYALAKELDEPLLFVGNDFIHTDIRPALI